MFGNRQTDFAGIDERVFVQQKFISKSRHEKIEKSCVWKSLHRNDKKND